MAYIDVEKAIRQLRGASIAKFPASFSLGILAAADEIGKMPTADVVEVKRGHWIKVQLTKKTKEYKCSECGHWEKIKYPYCTCGTKMDGTPKERGGEK